ncbi:MAG: hypothetical protein KAH44_29765 [Oricola sp.]|jgi:hypothetical protein|nr:hypothetical protein [Oricola sp.]
MEFAQKRMATQTWFTFEEHELNHRVRDNSGELSFTVDYAAIPSNRRIVFSRNNWLRNVGLIWCVLGVIQIGLAFMGGNPGLGAGFWLLIGLGCLGFYRLTWSEFTVLDAREGSIWIIKDKQHDEILGAIEERRKSHLLAWYKGLDFGDNPEAEVEAIEWLVKQKAISKDEGDQRIAEVRRSHDLLLTHKDDKPGPQVH